MNTLYFFEDIINEIEENLCADINIEKMAQKANMSIYEFRRIFSFVVKMPLNEYIRKRRLSVAVHDLLSKNMRITDVAAKYGYDSASSFSRAFKDFHGLSPTEVLAGNGPVKVLSKVSVDLKLMGAEDISFYIENETGFSVCGILGNSDFDDSECCEKCWDNFYKSDKYNEIVYGENEIYALYYNGENYVQCLIGAKNKEIADCRTVQIPPTRFATFVLDYTDDDRVNHFYNEILTGWLTSSGYERDYSIPNIEVFPKDMESSSFKWKIKIPLK